MPEMARIEQGLCRSAPWRWFARDVVLPWALQGEQLSGEVLEIGGGSGAMAAELLRRFPEIRLTVTDYDPSMVAVAQERVREHGARGLAQQADATRLPFPDQSFDCVVSFIMLHHVIDWEQAISEAVRVLRPGGRLVGYDLLASRALHWFHQAEGSAHRMMKLTELRRELRQQAVIGTVNRSTVGLTVRFALKKRPDTVA